MVVTVVVIDSVVLVDGVVVVVDVLVVVDALLVDVAVVEDPQEAQQTFFTKSLAIQTFEDCASNWAHVFPLFKTIPFGSPYKHDSREEILLQQIH